jgi:hypothetical protein
MPWLQSRESISEKLNSVDLERVYTQVKQSATNIVIIEPERLGIYLNQLLDELIQKKTQQSEPTSVLGANLLLESHGHAMCMNVQLKEKSGEQRLSLHFFDPNLTTSFQRASFKVNSEREQLAHISLESLLQHDATSRLVIDGNTIVIRTIPAVENRTNTIAPNIPSLHLMAPPSSSMLCHLMTEGLAEALPEYGQRLSTLGLDEWELIKHLSPSTSVGHGLHNAMYLGHAAVIEQYSELLEQHCRMFGPDDPRHSLISGLSQLDRSPALLAGFMQNQSKAIFAYAEMVKKHISDPELRLELILARSPTAQNVPGFMVAALGGLDDTTLTFGKTLFLLGLNPQDVEQTAYSSMKHMPLSYTAQDLSKTLELVRAGFNAAQSAGD